MSLVFWSAFEWLKKLGKMNFHGYSKYGECDFFLLSLLPILAITEQEGTTSHLVLI